MSKKYKFLIREALKPLDFNDSNLYNLTNLKETIYGNMAVVYHRTSYSDLINADYTSGFKPGDGDMYGKGFYSTYELSSQLRPYMRKMYGNVIIKFAVPIYNFFFFDYEEFTKTPQFKDLQRKYGTIIKDNFLQIQFKRFNLDDSNISYYDIHEALKKTYTSNLALYCIKHIPFFTNKVEGIVFTGLHDGHVLVSYNSKIIYPLSYTVDEGETWEKVEKNLEYLKKVIKNKLTPFRKHLSITPEYFDIENYEFDDEGFLNVDGNVWLYNLKLRRLPFKFGIVNGSFICNRNKLASLEGAPRVVKGDFNCSYNNLTDLKGAPEIVGGNFDCSHNDLITLKGSPKEIGGNFYCNDNQLISLEGAPEIIRGDFSCADNNLTTLKGAPQQIGENFECSLNPDLPNPTELHSVVKGEIIADVEVIIVKD